MSAVFEFRLDGFHFRTLDKWREEKSRVEVPGRMVPAQQRGNRYIKAHFSSGYAIVERTSPRETAKRHALEYGQAGIWHADDSVTVYTCDGDKLRQKLYRNTRLIS